MKKRAGVLILCMLLALSTFMLTACGGLSGAKVDKDSFDNTRTNFENAFLNGSVTLKFSSQSISTVRREELNKYSVDVGSYYNTAEKTSVMTTTTEKVNYNAVYDRDAIYIKEITDKEEKSSEGGISRERITNEAYLVKEGSYVYYLFKGLGGDWYALYKTNLSGYSVAEYAYYSFSNFAFSSYAGYAGFDDYEYSDGRYNLKQSKINDINESEQGWSDNYTYTYGDDYYYMVFNSNKLYGGFEHSHSVTVKSEYTQNWGSTEYSTETVTETVSKKQANIAYSGRVSVPNYTNIID